MTESSKIKVRTRDIPTAWLDARCRNLISKYALLAFRSDGTVLDLRNDAILHELSNHAKQTDVHELKELYNAIKNEIRKVISAPQHKVALSILSEKYNYLDSKYKH